MKIGMLQLNFLVGNFVGNTDKIIAGYKRAVDMGAELVVSTELALFGYPPKDMLCYQNYIDAQNQQLERLAKEIGNVVLIVGVATKNLFDGKELFNSAIYLCDGKIIGPLRHKNLLPTYDVFDEYRYFQEGEHSARLICSGKKISVLVCEDIWNGSENETGHKPYQRDPISELIKEDLDTLIVINASPYYLGKANVRFDLVSGIAQRLNCNVVYVNQVGGNDDLVFDGRSFAVNRKGECIDVAQIFEEDVVIVDTGEKEGEFQFFDPYHYEIDPLGTDNSLRNLYLALTLGTRDYVQKNGFEKVVIGLSGGIDSALTACIAVDALGKENVLGVAMPSKFSSPESVIDAQRLAANLGIELWHIRINSTYEALGETVEHFIGWEEPEKPIDVTEENTQARIRGMILMAISNRTKRLLLSTGNKSELSVGYCTLYGDMAGGYAVISDLWKTQVYELAHHINKVSGYYIIPKNTIEKPPSAELRPDQKDTDSLPPYEYLDQILQKYIEEEKGIDEIAFPKTFGGKKLVRKIIDMVNRAEHKRKQMPLGIKTSPKAYGFGRRWPISAKNL